MRQILVCVTFREFDSSINAKIHKKFLEGLQNQEYKRFRLIVTNYREKHVRKAVAESNLPYEFHQSKKDDCLYSWTEVIQNSFQYLTEAANIILWTNADNVFEPNLFSEIISNFEEGCGGTSYPHITYASLGDFQRGRPTDIWKNRSLKSFYQLDPNYWVPDTIWIDGDLLLNLDNQRLFLEYEFRDRSPGIAQTLVFAFFAKKLVNLIYRSRISVIKNVRVEERMVRELVSHEQVSEKEANKVFIQFHEEQSRIGLKTLKRFCEARGIPRKFRSDGCSLRKLNQHKEYKVVGRLDQRLLYNAYFDYWTLRNLIKYRGMFGTVIWGLQRLRRWLPAVHSQTDFVSGTRILSSLTHKDSGRDGGTQDSSGEAGE